MSEVDEVLAALADPTRRRLLDALGLRGPQTATALAAGQPVSRQAVVKHLAVLERAGVVAPRRQGREVLYSVRREPLDETARWLTERADAWSSRLAAIKRLAES
jgi:DNA-binding transcriptional ArsR family regulator